MDMSNPYRELKQIADKHGLNVEDVVHALIATVYSACCPCCSEKLQSDAFLQDFDHLAGDLAFCKDLSRRSAA